MQTAAQFTVDCLSAKGYEAETRGPRLVAVKDCGHVVLLRAEAGAVFRFLNARGK